MSERATSLLECDVCFEKYSSETKTPRLLLCGHTFCEECLMHLNLKGNIICPKCRQQTSTGPKGAKHLKRNFALINLLETLHNFELGTVCEECEKNPASQWCNDCTVSFCSSCTLFSIHKRALKHHKIVPLKDKAIGYCGIHSNENLSFFCLQCEIPICNICRDKEYGEHGTHEVNLVVRVENDKRKVVDNKTAEMKNHLSLLEDLSRDVAETAKLLETNELAVKKLINSNFDSLIAAVEQRRKQLLNDNASKSKTAKNKLAKQRSEIACLIANFSTLLEECSHISSRKGIALLQELKPLFIRLDEINKKYKTIDHQPLVSAQIEHNLPKEQIINLLKRFGSIEVGIANYFQITITKSDKVTSTSLRLFWKAKNRSKDIKTYAIQYRKCEEKQDDNDGWEDCVRTITTSQSISSLESDTSYDFRVCGLSKVQKQFPQNCRWSPIKTYKTVEDRGPTEFDFNCRNAGPVGPSQSACDRSYAGTSLENSVQVHGGIQRWIVPCTATYMFKISGARGGTGAKLQNNQKIKTGGAIMSGEFSLKKGTILDILVGQEGAIGDHRGGGGGGTFVVMEKEALIIAGGGGGICDCCVETRSKLAASVGGRTTKKGGVGNRTDSPNTSGDGSGGRCTHDAAGSGAGLNGNGCHGSLGTIEISKSFFNGGTGGIKQTPGGFGGGGSGYSCYGGGGGGYTGGNGTSDAAGGGGSLNTGRNQINEAVANEGPGQVLISRITPS